VSRLSGTTSYNSIYGLPEVTDPEQTFTDITRDQYDRYLRNFRDFERRLLDETDSTEMIDRARETTPEQTEKARQIARRNRERYGGAGLSNAQLQQQERSLQRQGQLNLAGNVNLARRQQRQLNIATLQDLIGIGQGVNRRSMMNLGNAAQGQRNRENAYSTARANYNAQMTGLGASMLIGLMSI